VVYTDVDPDVLLDEAGESWGFDLDADGLNDFNFFNKSFTTTVWNGAQGEISAIFAGAFDTLVNGLAGYTAYYSGYGGSTYFRPHALPENMLINQYLNFYNANYQTIAMIVYEPDFPPTTIRRGNWYPWYGEDITNHFLGFRFTDEEAVQRYGWIRCSVIDSGRTLIIHDYAYELQPDYPILAGDTISYVNINEQENTLNASVHSFGKSIYMHIKDFNNTQAVIYDVTGKEIFRKELEDTYSTIDMSNYSTGMYLATLKQGDKFYHKKIHIN
jgi:hypothetical protein